MEQVAPVEITYACGDEENWRSEKGETCDELAKQPGACSSAAMHHIVDHKCPMSCGRCRKYWPPAKSGTHDDVT